MVQIAVARPFKLQHPAHGHGNLVQYAVGLFDVPQAIADHPYVIAHCEAAVVAAGGALVQHRVPAQMSAASSNVFARSLQFVDSIAPAGPNDPVIDHWPPHVRPGLPSAGVEPPPIAFPQSAREGDYYLSTVGNLYQLQQVTGQGSPLSEQSVSPDVALEIDAQGRRFWRPLRDRPALPAPPPPVVGAMILRSPNFPPEDPQQAFLMRTALAGQIARMTPEFVPGPCLPMPQPMPQPPADLHVSRMTAEFLPDPTSNGSLRLGSRPAQPVQAVPLPEHWSVTGSGKPVRIA